MRRLGRDGGRPGSRPARPAAPPRAAPRRRCRRSRPAAPARRAAARASTAPATAAISRPPRQRSASSGASPAWRAAAAAPRRACAPGPRRRRRCRARSSPRRRTGRCTVRRRPWCCRCPSRPGTAGRWPGHRVVAGAKAAAKAASRHRRPVHDVRGRAVQRERDDAQRRAGHPRQLVDRGPPGREVRDHLRGDGGRVGRHAARRHAVVAGEHQHLDPVQPRHRPALPACQPAHQRLEPAEAAGRLGQRGLPGGHRRLRRRVPARQRRKGGRNLGLRHGASLAMAWKNDPVTWPRRPPSGPSAVPAASSTIA